MLLNQPFILCDLLTGAFSREAEANFGGSEPCGRCHSVQRRHHSNLHRPSFLLRHCAFRQVRSDRGHQHGRLHFLHLVCDFCLAGLHGPGPLQQTPRRCAEGQPGCDSSGGLGGGSVLDGPAAGGIGLAVPQHMNTLLSSTHTDVRQE